MASVQEKADKAQKHFVTISDASDLLASVDGRSLPPEGKRALTEARKGVERVFAIVDQQARDLHKKARSES